MEQPINEPLDEMRASLPEDQVEASEPEAVDTIGVTDQVSGDIVTFSKGFAGAVSAKQDVTIIQAGAGAIGAGEDATITYGGAMVIGLGGDLEVVNGGAMFLNAGGEATLTNGGAFSIMSGDNVTIRNGGAGLVFAQQVNLEEGSKILMDTKAAVAFGVAMGAAAAILSLLFRRRR